MPHTNKQFYIINSFVAGLVFSLFLTVIFIFSQGYFDWLFRWQTIVSGIITSLAAIGSVYYIYLQIHLTKEIENNRRMRVNLADRAALSSSLSALVSNQVELIGKLLKLYELFGDRESNSDHVELPTAEIFDFLPLITCIINAEIVPASDLSYLVSASQIQKAKLKNDLLKNTSRSNFVTTKAHVEDYIVDAWSIHARASRLIYYARRQDRMYERVSAQDQFQNSAFNLFIGKENWPRIWDSMERRMQGGEFVWFLFE